MPVSDDNQLIEISIEGKPERKHEKMKMSQKDSDKMVWDQMRSPSTTATATTISGAGWQTRNFAKLIMCLIFFVSLTYGFYAFKLVSTSRACNHEPFSTQHHLSVISSDSLIQNHTGGEQKDSHQEEKKTEIEHVVFGIAASAKLWEQRKEYIKIWFRPREMRGIVWLDESVDTKEDEGLPPIKISGDTSRFSYNNRKGHRSAIRISRIVSETLRLGLENVRWFVMGDDDTVFITENLMRVLRKYDHNQFYYIGSSSESHLQNIYFSYNMAYGGGGFAISYPLAKALHKMQDRCIQRYPGLYGSDDRMQACMAELGVPLTKELGFHQYDVYGDLFGLLAAHPVSPFVSVHHLDIVLPIFPNLTRVQSLKRLMVSKQLDSAALMQQSICYNKPKGWTISISWGFAVQIFRGILSPREIEMPSRTFLNWYRREDYKQYPFNTRPVSRNPCQKPFVFYMSKAKFDPIMNTTVTEYARHHDQHPACRWKMADPANLSTVVVSKKPDPHLWDRCPRRNCCRVMKTKKKEGFMIDVGVCRENEVIEV